MLAGAGLGAIAGVFVNQAATTAVPSVPKVAVGVGIMGVGALIPMFVKPSPFVLGAAAGMAGAGAIFAANEAGLSLPGISGMGTGYVTSTVGYLNQNKYPPRMIGGAGNLSGNGSRTVGRINGIFSN